MEYNINFDMASTSLFVAAGVTVALAVIGGFGLLTVLRWKPSDGEDNIVVGVGKNLYIVGLFLITFVSVGFTACQMPGCEMSTTKITLARIELEKQHRGIEAKNALIQSEIELLKLKESGTYNLPVPKDLP